MKNSRLPGLYKRTIAERQQIVADWAGFSDGQRGDLQVGLPVAQADKMVENVVGLYSLPFAVATNFLINGRDVLVPMVVEEPSVVAGASFAALVARSGGGFVAESGSGMMIGQIQVLDVPDPEMAVQRVEAASELLLALANQQDPVIVSLHGGARKLTTRLFPETPAGPMLVVHLSYDCRDAMGANMVNTACEALAPEVARLTGGRVNLRILSNLADERLASARCLVKASDLAHGGWDGRVVAQRIVEAYALAAVDPYRAATHNKGIMNGIDAVAVATGNDWRALEAGAHAYAARSGRYVSLSEWRLAPDGDLEGKLELPMAVGIVGGATRVHPTARLALQIMGATTAAGLGEVMAAAGLAQNLAALRALATEGIQQGHMALHARQVAIAAGATPAEVDRLARRLVAQKTIRVDRALEVLAELRAEAPGDGSGEMKNA
jgi:hydroxymethylglutaryl-CoA reductase